MSEIAVAVGLGMVLSLIITESLGVTAGGVIVPGYIAYNLHNTGQVLGTFAIAILVFFIVQGLSKIMFIYGKRRLVLCLLLGFLLGSLSKQFLFFQEQNVNLAAIGNIVPGLIASWMDRQGVVRTLSVIFVTAVIVQLFLMVLGMEIPHV